MPPVPTSSEPVRPVSGKIINSGPGPLLLVFLVFSLIFFILWRLLSRSPVDYVVLLAGNGLLFLVGMGSRRMGIQAMKSPKTQGFLRGVYGSFLLKFFVLIAAALGYIMTFQQSLNKPAFFGCFGLYLIYTFVETRGVMRVNTRTNA